MFLLLLMYKLFNALWSKAKLFFLTNFAYLFWITCLYFQIEFRIIKQDLRKCIIEIYFSLKVKFGRKLISLHCSEAYILSLLVQHPPHSAS